MKNFVVYDLLAFSAFYSQAEIIRYAAPNSIGNGKELLVSNYSDFLNRNGFSMRERSCGIIWLHPHITEFLPIANKYLPVLY